MPNSGVRGDDPFASARTKLIKNAAELTKSKKKKRRRKKGKDLLPMVQLTASCLDVEAIKREFGFGEDGDADDPDLDSEINPVELCVAILKKESLDEEALAMAEDLIRQARANMAEKSVEKKKKSRKGDRAAKGQEPEVPQPEGQSRSGYNMASSKSLRTEDTEDLSKKKGLKKKKKRTSVTSSSELDMMSIRKKDKTKKKKRGEKRLEYEPSVDVTGKRSKDETTGEGQPIKTKKKTKASTASDSIGEPYDMEGIANSSAQATDLEEKVKHKRKKKKRSKDERHLDSGDVEKQRLIEAQVLSYFPREEKERSRSSKKRKRGDTESITEVDQTDTIRKKGKKRKRDRSPSPERVEERAVESEEASSEARQRSKKNRKKKSAVIEEEKQSQEGKSFEDDKKSKKKRSGKDETLVEYSETASKKKKKKMKRKEAAESPSKETASLMEKSETASEGKKSKKKGGNPSSLDSLLEFQNKVLSEAHSDVKITLSRKKHIKSEPADRKPRSEAPVVEHDELECSQASNKDCKRKKRKKSEGGVSLLEVQKRILEEAQDKADITREILRSPSPLADGGHQDSTILQEFLESTRFSSTSVSPLLPDVRGDLSIPVQNQSLLPSRDECAAGNSGGGNPEERDEDGIRLGNGDERPLTPVELPSVKLEPVPGPPSSPSIIPPSPCSSLGASRRSRFSRSCSRSVSYKEASVDEDEIDPFEDMDSESDLYTPEADDGLEEEEDEEDEKEFERIAANNLQTRSEFVHEWVQEHVGRAQDGDMEELEAELRQEEVQPTKKSFKELVAMNNSTSGDSKGVAMSEMAASSCVEHVSLARKIPMPNMKDEDYSEPLKKVAKWISNQCEFKVSKYQFIPKCVLMPTNLEKQKLVEAFPELTWTPFEEAELATISQRLRLACKEAKLGYKEAPQLLRILGAVYGRVYSARYILDATTILTAFVGRPLLGRRALSQVFNEMVVLTHQNAGIKRERFSARRQRLVLQFLDRQPRQYVECIKTLKLEYVISVKQLRMFHKKVTNLENSEDDSGGGTSGELNYYALIYQVIKAMGKANVISIEARQVPWVKEDICKNLGRSRRDLINIWEATIYPILSRHCSGIEQDRTADKVAVWEHIRDNASSLAEVDLKDLAKSFPLETTTSLRKHYIACARRLLASLPSQGSFRDNMNRIIANARSRNGAQNNEFRATLIDAYKKAVEKVTEEGVSRQEESRSCDPVNGDLEAEDRGAASSGRQPELEAAISAVADASLDCRG